MKNIFEDIMENQSELYGKLFLYDNSKLIATGIANIKSNEDFIHYKVNNNTEMFNTTEFKSIKHNDITMFKYPVRKTFSFIFIPINTENVNKVTGFCTATYNLNLSIDNDALSVDIHLQPVYKDNCLFEVSNDIRDL